MHVSQGFWPDEWEVKVELVGGKAGVHVVRFDWPNDRVPRRDEQMLLMFDSVEELRKLQDAINSYLEAAELEEAVA